MRRRLVVLLMSLTAAFALTASLPAGAVSLADFKDLKKITGIVAPVNI